MDGVVGEVAAVDIFQEQAFIVRGWSRLRPTPEPEQPDPDEDGDVQDEA